MRNFTFFCFLCICCYMPSQAQQKDANIREDGAYFVVDQLPQYPDGQDAMMQFLTTNIKYPEDAAKQNITGRVLVQFVVGVDGRLNQMKVVRGVHPSLDAEAMRVVALMPPWIPGKHEGKIVPVVYNIPISFQQTAPLADTKSLGVIVSGEADPKPNLQGIWQLCISANPNEDGTYTVIPVPCFKVFSSDQTYFIMIAVNKPGMKSFVNSTGTYRTTSDSTYVENVTKSLSDPVLIGREMELTFNLINSNLLMTTYQMPNMPRRAKEYWTRVLQELPVQLPVKK